MTSHAYEVALFGEFFAQDLAGLLHASKFANMTDPPYNLAILNRFTLHSESAHPMHAQEILFEPFDAHTQRDTGTEPVLLRARKELLDPESTWCVRVGCCVAQFRPPIILLTQDCACRILYSYLKPESVRVHPEATVRPWATCQIVGDALTFASALGYVCA